MTVTVTGPVSFTVALALPPPLSVPLMLYVLAEEKFAEALPPFTVTFWLTGENRYPVLLGVTV